ncbi:MAG: hypothetical protein AAFV53_32730 [Myxococcota bacterium]
MTAALLVIVGVLQMSHAQDGVRSGFADEQRACRLLVDDTPTSKAGQRCARRLKWLNARQDPDGSFESLDALTDLRSRFRDLDPEDARQRATQLFNDPSAAKQNQMEAGLWLAREALRRDAPEDALPVTQRLWADAENDLGEGLTRKEIADVHARTLLLTGDQDGAEAVEERADLLRSIRPQEGLPLLLREQRRRRLNAVAWCVLGGFALLILPTAAQGWRKTPRMRPVGLAPLAIIVLLFAGLSALRSHDGLSGFAVLFGLLAGVHLLTLGALRRHPRGPGRWIIGLGAVVASIAAGFLSMRYGGQLDLLGL